MLPPATQTSTSLGDCVDGDPWQSALGACLVRTLRRHAALRGDKVALRFLERGERESDRATYAEIDRSARIVASNLRAAGVAGSPVLIALPQGLDFVRCFLGCLYAGAIAVPAPALGDPRASARLALIAAHVKPALVVCLLQRPGQLAALEQLRAAAGALKAAEPSEILSMHSEPETGGYDPAPGDIAFLQFTSGSTSRPKGVVITHGNITADLAMIGEAFAQDEHDSTVSWLPLHHDMGLIGCVLEPLNLGASAVLMSPLAFLQRPARWLRAIDAFQATTAGAPNFGYETCTRIVSDGELAGLDLSSWKLAFSGAEPIRAATLSSFARRFARCGFRAEAFYPCYGQAEATLFVTGGIAGSGVQEAGGPASGARPADYLPCASVSCGFPRLGSAVTLLDPQTLSEVPEGETGEIAIAGDQVSPGFWDPAAGIIPDADRETRVDGRRYLRTGDLGRLIDGNLYVVGRLRNMIILQGHNIHAEDVEQTVLAQPEAHEIGAVVAISIPGSGDREELAIVCELARGAAADDAAAHLEPLAGAVAQAHGVLPKEILLVATGTISRTLSGKLQHANARREFLGNIWTPLARHVPCPARQAPLACADRAHGIVIEKVPVPFSAPLPSQQQDRSLRALSYRLRVFDLILRDVIGPGNGRSYVDLGAGPLLFAQRARDAGFRVTGVDARPPWTGKVPPGVEAVTADVRRFNLDGYDVIGIVGLLYHLTLEEQIDLLRRCRGRPAIVDTEVYNPEVIREHGLDSARLRPAPERSGLTGAELDETGNVWSSVGNPSSFWADEASLLAMFEAAGWQRVTQMEPPYFSRFGRRRWYVLQ